MYHTYGVITPCPTAERAVGAYIITYSCKSALYKLIYSDIDPEVMVSIDQAKARGGIPVHHSSKHSPSCRVCMLCCVPHAPPES
jgi:hypothetical protein